MRDQKILIVDDSEMNRALLAEILEEQYQMEEAENGLEAIDILSRRAAEFSLILLDIFMPKCSGFEVLAYMNEYRLLENTAVIMISSELPEVMGMSDRILIYHEGKINGEVKREEILSADEDQESILRRAFGGK